MLLTSVLSGGFWHIREVLMAEKLKAVRKSSTSLPYLELLFISCRPVFSTYWYNIHCHALPKASDQRGAYSMAG